MATYCGEPAPGASRTTLGASDCASAASGITPLNTAQIRHVIKLERTLIIQASQSRDGPFREEIPLQSIQSAKSAAPHDGKLEKNDWRQRSAPATFCKS